MTDDAAAGTGSDAAIVTPTLAALYARQGHTARALQMYRRLAAEAPDDPELVRCIDSLRARLERERRQAAREDRVERLRVLLRRVRARRREQLEAS